MDWTEYITIQNTTALLGVVTGVTGFIFGYRERKIANNKSRIENADKINEIYNNLLHDIDEAESYRKKYFSLHIDYCKENLEDFIKFIKNKSNAKSK